MAQAMNQDEVIRWMDDFLGIRPQIQENANRVIAGMWSFSDRMRSRTMAVAPREQGHQG